MSTMKDGDGADRVSADDAPPRARSSTLTSRAHLEADDDERPEHEPEFEALVHRMLQFLGEDPDREGLTCGCGAGARRRLCGRGDRALTGAGR